MSQTIEVEAKTIQDAIEEAANKFGVSPEKLEVEILDTGAGKIFGVLGGRAAKIRVTLKGKEDEKPAEQKSEAVGSKWGKGVEPEFEVPKRSYAIDVNSGKIPDSVEDARKRGKLIATNTFEPSDKIPDSVEDARKALENLCRFIEPDVQIQIVPAQDHYRLCIPGGGSGLFIGKNGQTLEALQYLVNRVMSQRGHADLKIVVDSEDYRVRRNNQLADFVKKLADKARRTGRIQYTDMLNAFDRRVVHMALKDEKGVDAHSVGVGDRREIQIKPTGQRSQFQRGRPRTPRNSERSNRYQR